MESAREDMNCADCGGALTGGPFGLRCGRCVLAMLEDMGDEEMGAVAEIFPELHLESQVAKGGFGAFYGRISILLNRVGRTSSNPAGTIVLTFDDAATADIHSAPGVFNSSLSGTFQPSGRNIHPFNALDTTPHRRAQHLCRRPSRRRIPALPCRRFQRRYRHPDQLEHHPHPARPSRSPAAPSLEPSPT